MVKYTRPPFPPTCTKEIQRRMKKQINSSKVAHKHMEKHCRFQQKPLHSSRQTSYATLPAGQDSSLTAFLSSMSKAMTAFCAVIKCPNTEEEQKKKEAHTETHRDTETHTHTHTHTHTNAHATNTDRDIDTNTDMVCLLTCVVQRQVLRSRAKQGNGLKVSPG